MKDTKIVRLRQGAKALLVHFSDPSDDFFARVIGTQEVAAVVARHVKVFRRRIFSPLDTLRLFVGQMLSADGACQDVVARRLSERVEQGETQNTLNTASYCLSGARAIAACRDIQRDVPARPENPRRGDPECSCYR